MLLRAEKHGQLLIHHFLKGYRGYACKLPPLAAHLLRMQRASLISGSRYWIRDHSVKY